MKQTDSEYMQAVQKLIATRRTNQEARVCSQPGCPGDGRYQPPGKGHLMNCTHDAIKWVWEEVRPLEDT